VDSNTADKDIIRHIARSAEAYFAPDGKRLPVISLKTAASIANSQGISAKDLEIIALKSTIPSLALSSRIRRYALASSR
jgi:hypothetical protein